MAEGGKGITDLKKLNEATIVNITSCRNTGYSTPVNIECNLTRDEAIEFIQADREIRSGLVYKFTIVSKEQNLLKKVNSIQKDEFKLRQQINELEAKMKRNAAIRTQVIANIVGVQVGDELQKGSKRFIIKSLDSTFDDIMGDAILLQGMCMELKSDGTD